MNVNPYFVNTFLLVLMMLLRTGMTNPGMRDSDELIFTVEPVDTVITRDKPVMLDCAVSMKIKSHITKESSPTLDVQWTRNGVPVVINNRRHVLANGSLLIDSRSDEGLYQCTALVRGLGSIVSRKAKLQLAYLEKNFIEEPENTSARLGDTVFFSCLIDGAPKPQIQWYIDEHEIDLESISYYSHPEDGVLEIQSVQLVHFGRYKCKAMTVDRSKYSNVALLTQITGTDADGEAPYFVMKPKDRVVVEGGSVVLYCGTNGRDENEKRPTILWLKDGVTLDLNLEDDRISLVGEGSLKINEIEEDDSGLYTCRATNSIESIDASSIVSVLVPTKLELQPENAVGQVQSDRELFCEAYGIPRPAFQWFRNGAVIVPDDYIQVIDGHNLRIMGLLLSDEGMYQCVATNSAGSSQAVAQLIVLSKDVQSSTVGCPSQPVDLVALIVSMHFITLSWKQPASPGMSDVIGYVVLWNESKMTRKRELNTTTLEANIQQLKPATRYTVDVYSYNNHCMSEKAAQIMIETQDEAQVPDPPLNLEAFALSSTSIHTSWEGQQVNLSIPITSFKLFFYELGDETAEREVNLTSGTYAYIIRDLKKFHQYSFRVAASNSNGLGMTTEEVTCWTYSDVPSAPPQNASAETQSAKSIMIHWLPPNAESLNGIITGYKIRYKQNRDGSKVNVITTDGIQGMASLTDLAEAAEYSYSIQALNRNGSGPQTAWHVAHTLVHDLGEMTVPSAPSSLQVRPLTSSIVVSWTPPVDQNVMIRGYILGYGIGIPDVYRQILDAKQRYHTIKGLQASSEYVISLRAFNGAGEGNTVYATTITREETTPEPTTPIIPPVGLKAIVLSSTAIVLMWTDTTLGHNQRVTDNRFYTIRFTPRVQRKPKLINSTDLNVHIEDLKPDTEYEFSVKIVKGRRQSTWSLSVLNKTKEAVPGSAPRDVTPVIVENRINWLSLSWQPPRQPNGQITGYLIFYTTDASLKDRDWVLEGVLGDRLSTTIKDLSLETTYYFKVQARNNVGYGSTSPTLIFRTPRSDGTGGGPVEMPDDYGKMSRNSYREPADSRGMSPSASPVTIPASVLWISIGCVGGFTVVAVVIVLAVFCHRKHSKETHSNRHGYMPANKSKSNGKDLKPPDLWIHDRIEMKDVNKSDDVDEGTAMMSRESQESNDYIGDQVGFDQRDFDRQRRIIHRPKPVMIPVDQPPVPMDPYVPTISNGYVDSNAVVVRPVYPRTQYTCQYSGAPRVNAGHIPPQSSGITSRQVLPNCVQPANILPISPAGSVAISPRSPADHVSDSKSYTAEELTAEIANLDGLMKDLSEITQHEFEC